MSANRETPRPPRPVTAWLALVNVGMGAAVVFVLTQVDNVIFYVFGAPLVIVFFITGGSYAWVFFTGRGFTSRSRSSGSRGSRSP